MQHYQTVKCQLVKQQSRVPTGLEYLVQPQFSNVGNCSSYLLNQKCAAWHTAGLACELQMQSAEQLSAFSAEGLRSGGRSLQQPWLDIFPYFRGGGGRIKIWGEIWAFRGAFFLYLIGKFKPFIEIILWKNIDPCTAQTRLATQPAS